MPTDTGGSDGPVLLLDTSAAIPLVVDSHDAHSTIFSATQGRRLGLPGHAWFEAYSVLTRLPADLRRSPADVLAVLTRSFPGSVFLGEDEAAALGPELARLAISGGAVYDALVAAAARHHGLTLMSRDARARPTYEALGVTVMWVG